MCPVLSILGQVNYLVDFTKINLGYFRTTTSYKIEIYL